MRFNSKIFFLVFMCLMPKITSAAERIDFRGISLGMSIDEVNASEAVHYGYMPKLVFADVSETSKAAHCDVGHIAVFPRETEPMFVVERKGESGYEKNANWTVSEGAAICSTKRSNNYENARFRVKLKFWKNKLFRVVIQYSRNDFGSLSMFEKFHSSIYKKLNENSNLNLRYDIKRDKERWQYFVGSHDNIKHNSVQLSVMHAKKISAVSDFLVDNPIKSVRLQFDDDLAHSDIRVTGEKLYSNYLKQLAQRQRESQLNDEKARQKKQELDKKFLN